MDCVDQILEFYKSKAKSENEQAQLNKVWLSKILIKLMKNFNGKKSKDLELKNCLILLVNLFSDSDTPDFYNHKGKKTDELSNKEKSDFKNILRGEFLYN